MLLAKLSKGHGTNGFEEPIRAGALCYLGTMQFIALHMLGYDVTRGIPDGAFLLAVHPGTNLPKADFLDSVAPRVAPRVASICDEISCRLIYLLHSVSCLLIIDHKQASASICNIY